jgi:hypothetical protein
MLEERLVPRATLRARAGREEGASSSHRPTSRTGMRQRVLLTKRACIWKASRRNGAARPTCSRCLRGWDVARRIDRGTHGPNHKGRSAVVSDGAPAQVLGVLEGQAHVVVGKVPRFPKKSCFWSLLAWQPSV